MNEHAKDVLLGTAGAVSTITIGQFNQIVALLVGLVTLAVMSLRFARELGRSKHSICERSDCPQRKEPTET